MKYLSPGSLLGAVLAAALLGGGCGDDGNDQPDAGDDDGAPDAGEPDAQPGDPASGAWREGFGLPGPFGFGSRVEDVAIGPDGHVYIGGIFVDAAGVPVANVATWTGTDWAPLGAGLDGWVRAIDFDSEGVLWAGVTTESPDGLGGALMTWNGTSWTSAGTLDGAVRGIAAYEDGIAVVGDFATAGGVNAASVAIYDGAAWHAPGDGTVGNGAASAVVADGTGFCVAGMFDAIGGVSAENAACFSGTDWTALGAGLPGGVDVLVRSPGGTWFAGGTLTFTVDPETGGYEAGIASLVGGTWQPFEGGIDNGFINEVRAIAFDGTDVIVGGHFQSAGDSDVPASHLARWSPVAGWSEIADGLRSDVGVVLEYYRGASDIVVDADGSLWVGGIFTQVGDTPAVNLSHVSAAGVPSALVGAHPVLGIGGFVDALARTADGHVVAGGYFHFAGLTTAEGFAVFDGSAWTAVAGMRGLVRAVAVLHDGSIAVGGELDVAGTATGFAVWSDGAWSLPGGAVDGPVYAIVEHAGAVWIGGKFSHAGTTTTSNLARLAGGAWTASGSFDDRVTALAIYDGKLVAGGLFATPGAAIAIGDGETWAALGGGADGDFPYATSIGVSPTLGLIVGGEFDGAGGVAAPDLIRWDGAWHAVAGGVTAESGYGFVSAVLPYGDGVFVAGGFDHGGDVPAANIAYFDGTAWHALGTGLADLAETMVVVDHALHVGGPFTEAGSRPASGIAVWDFASE